MKKAISLSLLVCGLILFLVGAGLGISYNNQEVRLSEAITSKIKDNKSHYTKMWTIIKQQAEVSEKYAEDFKEIYPSLIEGRYSNGQGKFMNWIQEHNPNFDTSLYSKLMSSIEAQRESFHTTQSQLIDLSREHNTLIKVIPSKWFLASVEPIEIPVIINDEAEKAFSTGKEKVEKLF